MEPHLARSMFFYYQDFSSLLQSFPYLLKELAQLVTLLPKEGQDAVLDDMHTHVAESDDVTRKPVLVSWLQSLSYLSSQLSCWTEPWHACDTILSVNWMDACCK
jgi:hypothetical protein